ncbi:hypothetical protein SAMN05216321_106117 [Cupriavidus sp. OV038]|uniref:hypothetical protein n=1 Tax=unclassified Cupriavidus TaxID=2640874 RepID=UPI0008E232E1|nr:MULTISPECIES: hypothetical protein [unclassified Cupriavidus]SFC69542.1 hypothetical protein SAMN05216321_106117 [Cupriavidus sp. OV038]SFO73235.1 hypothetical protein SAMN05216322_102117 [Cupriavidus sp. OV096]
MPAPIFVCSKNMIGEALSTVKLIETIGKFVAWLRKTRSRPAETVAGRFIRVFESHGVHRNQIPRFFDHGLTLKDVRDEISLLDKLDEPMLEAASKLFGIRREWLEGAESEVYPCHDFYKHPASVAPFLEALKASNPDGNLDGVLIAPEEQEGDALIVLSEVVGWIGDKAIHRHHLLNNWLYDYWKSRGYLTACVAIAWKHGVRIRGTYSPAKEIKQVAYGEVLLGGRNVDNTPSRRGTLYPEDMALRPAAFLVGIDPERDNFGITSALELWQMLEEDGYMATGLSMYQREAIRGLFKEALDKSLAATSHPPEV